MARKTGKGPDFIGVGVPKAGTSWLDSILRKHPQIWMPPIKEIHFFDDFYSDGSNKGLNRYFSDNLWIKNRRRRDFIAVSKHALRYPSWNGSQWAIRYLVHPLSYSWYSRLFDEQNLTTGEFTPGYCTLKTEQISEIADHYHDLKILLMLRNPAERAWSHCRMELFSRPGKEVNEVSESEIREFLFHDRGVLARSEYSRILQAWRQVFGKHAVFVGLLDEVKSNPSKLANDVFAFLEVDNIEVIDFNLKKKVHVGKKIPIPELIRDELCAFYREEIWQLNSLLPYKNINELWFNSAWN